MDPVILRIGSWLRSGSEQPILSTRIQQLHKSAHDTAAAAISFAYTSADVTIRRAKKWGLLPVFTLLALIASIGEERTGRGGIRLLRGILGGHSSCREIPNSRHSLLGCPKNVG